MSRFGTEPDETNHRAIDVCRQCQREMFVNPYDGIPDGPYVCDSCYTATMRREFQRMDEWNRRIRAAREVA